MRFDIDTLQFGTLALFEFATPTVIGDKVAAGGCESLIRPRHDRIHTWIPLVVTDTPERACCRA